VPDGRDHDRSGHGAQGAGGARRSGPLSRALIWGPAGLGVVAAALWIALRVGALDAFPWPQEVTFEGDAAAFVSCFEARSKIAARRGARFVQRDTGDSARRTDVLVQLGDALGRDGLRSVALLRGDGRFTLRDRHYQADHSPLSQPMKKTDWITAWRCHRAAR
jgi:hypothetical protein